MHTPPRYWREGGDTRVVVRLDVRVPRTCEGEPSIAAERFAVMTIRNGERIGFVIFDRLLQRIVDGTYYDKGMALWVCEDYYNRDCLVSGEAPDACAPTGAALGLLYPSREVHKPAKVQASWPPLPRNLVRAVMERDAYRCVSCGNYHDLTCDHIIPFSRGGPSTLDNLQTMCRSCNASKGARV